MDTAGKLMNPVRNNNGIAVEYIALIIIFLIAFVGLAIDIGYMYVTKGHLQNAADSAALAGADKLKSSGTGTASPTNTVQTAARQEAVAFAAKNQMIKCPVWKA